MRSRKAIINIMTSLILQITTILCGLIVPKLIINTYGSGVNGLIASISQFLTYIVLLEAGVGGVVRAALYKKLAQNDVLSISRTLKATKNFFERIAFVFIAYLVVISLILSILVSKDFNYIYTISLVIIIGISNFFQYYFGISYQILLQADQRQYINNYMQLLTIVANTILVVILIYMGVTIHFVKLASSLIFIVRPILLNLYVNKHYSLVSNCSPDTNSISQRWDGFGHHIAFFVNNSTDLVILTIFSNIKEVSVYSIYFMIISSVKNITVTFTSGLEAAFGDMLAKNEKISLNKNFKIFEFISFSVTTILFTSTAILILPFIILYTEGVTDVNYYRPIFAAIITLSYALYCIRIPYNAIVIAAGHFKQTRNGAFLEAIINITVSILLVNHYGIVGVAIGTFLAMLFRTAQYILYLSKNIIKISLRDTLIKVIIYSLVPIINIFIFEVVLNINITNYLQWFFYALSVTILVSIITFLLVFKIYTEEIRSVFFIVKKILKSNKI